MKVGDRVVHAETGRAGRIHRILPEIDWYDYQVEFDDGTYDMYPKDECVKIDSCHTQHPPKK